MSWTSYSYSGTPTTAGTYNIQIGKFTTNNVNLTSQNFVWVTITVSSPPVVSFSVNNSAFGYMSNTSSITLSNLSTVMYSSGNTVYVGNSSRTATANSSVTGYHDVSFSRYEYSYNGSSWTTLTSNVTITQNVTIRAVFTATINTYTVTINSNNTSYGTVTTSSVTVNYNTSISSNGNVLTVGSTTSTANKTGNSAQYSYSFTGWSGIPSGGKVTSNITVTANFTRTTNSYTVTFMNGNTTIHTESVAYNGTITHTSHSISGKVFCGWYNDSSFTSAFSTSTKITANKILYGYFSDPLAFTSSPVASATITYASGLGCVLFDALESQSAAKVLWDFGDGTYGNEIVMYHHYEQPGTYSILLSVYNSEGEMDTHTYDVIVYDTADGPPGNDNTLLIAGSIVAALVVGFLIARPF